MGTKASNPVFDGDHSVSRWETDRMLSVSVSVNVEYQVRRLLSSGTFWSEAAIQSILSGNVCGKVGE